MIVVCGPPKCLHQFFQAIRRTMEALAGINFFDFDDAAASPAQWPDRMNAVSPIANEPILNGLRHLMPPSLDSVLRGRLPLERTQRVVAAGTCTELVLQRKCEMWQSGDLVTGDAPALRYRARMNMQSLEECLREAEESERLAGLARSVATRQIMTVMALKWRRLAKMAAERQSHPHPNIQPGVRIGNLN